MNLDLPKNVMMLFTGFSSSINNWSHSNISADSSQLQSVLEDASQQG